MIKFFFTALVLVNVLVAQDFERIAPRKPNSSSFTKIKDHSIPLEKVEKDQILIPKLLGIRLLKDIADVSNSEHLRVKGIKIIDFIVPGPKKELQQDLKSYLEKPLTKQGLVHIKRQIILYYQKYDRPIVHVFIPEQNVTQGVLQVIIYESKLGDITVKGNCFFCNQSYLCEMYNKKNCPINTETLVQDLDWINRNPFRNVDAIFVPSVQEGYTDIQLVACDRKPFRFFSGVENTGLDLTGHNRYFLGINHGNVFGLGHLFSYQFTIGSHYDEFWAQSFNYSAPLFWRHILTIYGGLSRIDAILPSENQNAIQNDDFNDATLMKTHGMSAQASIRYNIPIDPINEILQDTTFGFDFKRSDTSLTLNGLPFTGQSVNLTQFMLGYNQGFESKRYRQGLTFEVFFSPFEWLPDQSNEQFNSLRQNAKNTYIYARAAWSPLIFLPKCFVLEPTVRWQIASTNLLASEQMGLGGYDSVRGYEEREINIDNGIIINIDLKAPPIPLFSYFPKAQCRNEGLVLLIFFDMGYGKNHSLVYGEKSSYSLYGIGPGFRYYFEQNISVRGDWGYQLKSVDCNPRSSMFHFGGTFSF